MSVTKSELVTEADVEASTLVSSRPAGITFKEFVNHRHQSRKMSISELDVGCVNMAP